MKQGLGILAPALLVQLALLHGWSLVVDRTAQGPRICVQHGERAWCGMPASLDDPLRLLASIGRAVGPPG